MRTLSKNTEDNNQVVIVGGGLAGLISAIQLSKAGIQTVLIEKHTYPKHKVCGEYISNEVLPYLNYLGFDPYLYGAKKITTLSFSTYNGKSFSATLPLGGFGISRYCMDSQLADIAVASGVQLITDNVNNISFSADRFQITTSTQQQYTSDIVIGAHGKRSIIDSKLSRPFMNTASPFLAVKAHYSGHFPDNQVNLHTFPGGYCGISKVETGHINVCYITDYESFKQYKNIEDFQKTVVSKNKHLKEIFSSFNIVFKKPLTISQVSFAKKNPVEQHILMTGDSAGMIHPLAGNGMSMAVRSAQIVSQQIIDYFNGKTKSRDRLESKYAQEWNKEFKSRLNAGHIIAKIFRSNRITESLISISNTFPSIIPHVIKRTHGKPMTV